MTTNFKTLPTPELAEFPFKNSQTSISILTDQSLWEHIGVRIAFTNRLGGVSPSPFLSLNLHHKDGDSVDNETANRALLQECFLPYVNPGNLICPNQIHSDKIIFVDDLFETCQHAQKGADGIICDKQAVPVLLCFADCVPVIAVAPNAAFAVLHAGWRGAFADIVAKGIQMLAKSSSCESCDCNIYIGPHIGSCCFEVSDELCKQFTVKYGKTVMKTPRHISLFDVIVEQLKKIGVDKSKIAHADICTACNTDKYYSYRRENGKTGRHGAYAFRR